MTLGQSSIASCWQADRGSSTFRRPATILRRSATRSRPPGIGFSRELQLLGLARARGLSAIAHVTTGEQAQRAAAEGAEIVCFNYGWNAGGVEGVKAAHSLIEAAAIGAEVKRLVHLANSDALLMLEGGPIKTAQDLKQVLSVSNADGYIGGSTIDRLAFEDAVANQNSHLQGRRAFAQQRQVARARPLPQGTWGGPGGVLERRAIRCSSGSRRCRCRQSP